MLTNLVRDLPVGTPIPYPRNSVALAVLCLRTIEIIVAPDGQTTVQTRGFQGSSCRDASRLIEQAIGNPTGEKLTTEFYQKGSIYQSQQQRS
jgi:hypothetical protein